MSKKKRRKTKQRKRKQKAQTKQQSKAIEKRKQERLANPRPEKCPTQQAAFPLPDPVQGMVARLEQVLDERNAWRLPIIMAGMVLADGRRTASRWFEAARVKDDWGEFYYVLISVGQQAQTMSQKLLPSFLDRFDTYDSQDRILLALDDSPTKRFGPEVEGAGVHHNPTPGPADGKWLYGHSWVTLSWLAEHPRWGTLGLPWKAALYVREDDIEELNAKRTWEFRTKHALGADLVQETLDGLRKEGSQAQVWLVADGGYAARPFLLPVMQAGVTIISRLRKDAKLWDLPPTPSEGQRGRPRIYGHNRLSLAIRSGHPHGWSQLTYRYRGKRVTREYKTFLATSRLVRGVIRVVIVRTESGGWLPFFSTNPEVSAQDILEAVGDRWAIEENFHDVKEVWGASQQQVRNVWSNVGCWHLNLWMISLVELWAWDLPASELCDRSDRPWDDACRRPSHADRRRALGRRCLEGELSQLVSAHPDQDQIRPLVEELLKLAL